ncbi:hypothetical protein [Wheat umbra-like virus]|nr:hypothetical protein [Wheat umbra-like virus]
MANSSNRRSQTTRALSKRRRRGRGTRGSVPSPFPFPNRTQIDTRTCLQDFKIDAPAADKSTGVAMVCMQLDRTLDAVRMAGFSTHYRIVSVEAHVIPATIHAQAVASIGNSTHRSGPGAPGDLVDGSTTIFSYSEYVRWQSLMSSTRKAAPGATLVATFRPQNPVWVENTANARADGAMSLLVGSISAQNHTSATWVSLKYVIQFQMDVAVY